MHDDDIRITGSSGNVFLDLGFSPEEAAILAMRADLMARLRLLIEEHGWTQTEATERLRIGQSHVSDLVRGNWDKFSLDNAHHPRHPRRTQGGVEARGLAAVWVGHSSLYRLARTFCRQRMKPVM